MKPTILLVAFAVVFASACSTSTDRAADGVDLPTITVSAEPSLVLADDGSAEKQFTRVTARRLPSGEIVVADQGSVAIHVFGRDGSLVRTLASRGPGPGELPGAFKFTTIADTAFAFGQRPMSPPDVHVFAAPDGYVRTFRPTTDSAPSLTTLDRLTTGELLVQRGAAFQVVASMPAEGERRPDSVTFGLYRDAGAGRDAGIGRNGVVTWLPTIVRHYFVGYDWPNGPVPRTMTPLTLGERTFVLVSGDRVWTVNTATGALRAYDGSGREIVAAALGIAPEPFDGAALERERSRLLAAATRALDSARARATTNTDILPATAPLLDAAYAGADGELWLRLLDLGETSSQRFVVVDHEGNRTARASVPSGLDIQHIGRDFILGIQRDSLGVESVMEYALSREPPAGD